MSFSSEMGQRRSILSSLLEAIDSNNLHVQMTREELQLVLDEALTNAMEHEKTAGTAESAFMLRCGLIPRIFMSLLKMREKGSVSKIPAANLSRAIKCHTGGGG